MAITFGFKLSAEAFGPAELIEQARAAEAAGFDFVEISDHFHPWLEEQGHSPFTWTVLGAIAQATSSIGLATGVTCPIGRYHPAIVAQAAATVAVLSQGRFTLGVGAGERLNEHVVGPFPGIRERHERLGEAIEIIRALWQGGYRSYVGDYFELDDARLFDLPETPPVIAVAAGGAASARLAARHGDGIFAVAPDAAIIEAYEAEGGSGPRFAEIPLAWAPSKQQALDAAMRTSRWSLAGWKVMSELPSPEGFAAASRTVRPEDLESKLPCGPDAEPIVASVRAYRDAGFDHLVLQDAGPDPLGFIDFFARELHPRLERQL